MMTDSELVELKAGQPEEVHQWFALFAELVAVAYQWKLCIEDDFRLAKLHWQLILFCEYDAHLSESGIEVPIAVLCPKYSSLLQRVREVNRSLELVPANDELGRSASMRLLDEIETWADPADMEGGY